MPGPVLITGAEGFAGTHLLELLAEDGVAADVDVLDAGDVAGTIRATEPRAVVHLAAQSSVAASWTDVSEVWSVNVLGTVNVLDAVSKEQPQARVLFASTG